MKLDDYYIKLRHDPHLHRDYCIFRCGGDVRPPRTGRATLAVEMNVGPSGRFLASTNDEAGSVRVAGVAHPECFEAWQAIAYGLPLSKAAETLPTPVSGWRSRLMTIWRALPVLA